jgi:hypothetical protein
VNTDRSGQGSPVPSPSNMATAHLKDNSPSTSREPPDRASVHLTTKESACDLDIRCVRLKPYKLGDEILLDIEQIIPLPEAEDYQVKVKEQTEERRAAAKAARDMTKYLFKGTAYRKNRLVLAVISQYCSEHPDTTLQKLKEVFPDFLQGALGVTSILEKAQEIVDRTDKKRHFLADSEILRTADNLEIAVCTQWGTGNIENFIDYAKKLGYQIEAE